MAWINVFLGTDRVEALEVSQGRISLGRESANGIVLADNSVSRTHAHIEVGEGGSVRIIDNRSKNGVFLNGKKVTESEVCKDDIINIGPYTIYIAEEELIQTKVSEKEIVDSRPSISGRLIGFLIPVKVPGLSPDIKHITLYDDFLIGRGEDNHFVLEDSSVSSRHALFKQTEGEVVVEDQASLNGIKIDGDLIEKSQAIQSGDRIEIGNCRFDFYTSLDDAIDKKGVVKPSDKKKDKSKKPKKEKKVKADATDSLFQKTWFRIAAGVGVLIVLLSLCPNEDKDAVNFDNILSEAKDLAGQQKYQEAVVVLKQLEPQYNDLSVDEQNTYNTVLEQYNVKIQAGDRFRVLSDNIGSEDIEVLQASLDELYDLSGQNPEDQDISDLAARTEERLRLLYGLKEVDELLQSRRYTQAEDRIEELRMYFSANGDIVNGKVEHYLSEANRYEQRRARTTARAYCDIVLALDPSNRSAKALRTKLDYTPPAPSNRRPVVGNIQAGSSTVAAGERMALSVNASDPDKDRLAYTWSCSKGEIQGDMSRAVYITPSDLTADVDVDIYVEVSDGHNQAVRKSKRIRVSVPRVVLPEQNVREANKLYLECYRIDRTYQIVPENTRNEIRAKLQRAYDLVKDDPLHELTIKIKRMLDKYNKE